MSPAIPTTAENVWLEAEGLSVAPNQVTTRLSSRIARVPWRGKNVYIKKYTLETDLAVFETLAPLAPGDRLLVAESGMKTVDDVRRMRAAGAQAVLVGESLMRAGGSVSRLVSSLSG